MGCGGSKPRSATTIWQQSGCEWTAKYRTEVLEICAIVSEWNRDKDGAKAKRAFEARVLKGTRVSSAWGAAAEGMKMASQFGAAAGVTLAHQTSGMLGALVGGAMGALAGGISGGMHAQQVHKFVVQIFTSTEPEAKKLAEESLASGVIKEVYNVDAGVVTVQERTEKLTGRDCDDIFRQKVEDMAVGQEAGAEKLLFLELTSLCLCIEVLRM